MVVDLMIYHNVQRHSLHLANKFKRDSAYAAEYKVFMDDVLSKDYAEKVPQDQLHWNDNHVWYIPQASEEGILFSSEPANIG